MADEVLAFLGGYAACDGPEGLPKCLDAAQSHLPQQSLQLGEDLFDGVEIGTIGGQEQQGRAGGLDGLAHGGLLVGSQIIHHDDVAGSQRRHQNLFDVAQEQVGVDRAVEHSGGDETIFS